MDDFPIWYPMTVRVKVTGETMVIKSSKFNPELFEKITSPQTIVEKPVPQEVEQPSVPASLACESCAKTFKREQDFKSHNTRFHSTL